MESLIPMTMQGIYKVTDVYDLLLEDIYSQLRHVYEFWEFNHPAHWNDVHGNGGSGMANLLSPPPTNRCMLAPLNGPTFKKRGIK